MLSLPAQERYTDLNEQDQDPPEASEDENTEELKEAVKKVPIPSPSSVPQVTSTGSRGPSDESKLVESLREELRVAHARIKELLEAGCGKAPATQVEPCASAKRSADVRARIKELQDALAAKKLLGLKVFVFHGDWPVGCCL